MRVVSRRREVEPGKWTLVADDYVPIFRKLGVTCVIRFNKRCYDRRRFVDGGIKHVDLFYEDGGNPAEEILQKFLRICEGNKASRDYFGAAKGRMSPGAGGGVGLKCVRCLPIRRKTRAISRAYLGEK